MRIGGVRFGILEFLFLVFASMLLCCVAPAQTTSVTATITDTDGQTWNNGSWSATLYNPFPANPPSINGVKLTASQINLSGTLSSSGVLTSTFSDNSFIAPTGTQWYITICPNANTQCSTGLTAITGTTANLSTLFSSYTKPIRVPASWQAYMYRDSEIYPIPVPGGRYWNVVSSELRCWTGSAWVACGSGGGGSGCNVTSGNDGYIIIANGTSCEPANNTSLGIKGLDNGSGISLIETGGGGMSFHTSGGFDLVQEGGTPGDINIRNTDLAGDINILQQGGPSSSGEISIQNDAQGGILIQDQLNGGELDMAAGFVNLNGPTTTIEALSGLLKLIDFSSQGITLDSDASGTGTGPIVLHSATDVEVIGPSSVAGAQAYKAGTSPNSGTPGAGYIGISGPTSVTNPYWLPLPGTFPGSSTAAIGCSGTSSPLSCDWYALTSLIVGTPTFVDAGAITTSCNTGYTCTNTRGEILVNVPGGGWAGGTFTTMHFSATLGAAPFCTVFQNGGSTFNFFVGHGIPSTTTVDFTMPSTGGPTSIPVDYSCTP